MPDSEWFPKKYLDSVLYAYNNPWAQQPAIIAFEKTQPEGISETSTNFVILILSIPLTLYCGSFHLKQKTARYLAYRGHPEAYKRGN